MAEQDLPNLGLLVKLLKLTTSSNDQEALMAIRKANEQLLKFGGDWERLLHGKVTVISDPFIGKPAPNRYEVNRDTRTPSVPQPPKPARASWADHRAQAQNAQVRVYAKPYPQSTVRMARTRTKAATKRGSLESLA